MFSKKTLFFLVGYEEFLFGFPISMDWGFWCCIPWHASISLIDQCYWNILCRPWRRLFFFFFFALMYNIYIYIYLYIYICKDVCVYIYILKYIHITKFQINNMQYMHIQRHYRKRQKVKATRVKKQHLRTPPQNIQNSPKPPRIWLSGAVQEWGATTTNKRVLCRTAASWGGDMSVTSSQISRLYHLTSFQKKWSTSVVFAVQKYLGGCLFSTCFKGVT